MFFSYKEAMTFVPVIITGVVMDAQTGQPLSNTCVFIVKGAEETVTDKCGNFSIKTWQPLPVPVTVQQFNACITQNVRTSQNAVRIFVPRA